MSGRPPPCDGRASSDRPRHLILTVDFKPMVGGIAQYLHGLAGALTEHGPVEVVAYGVEPDASFAPPYHVRYLPAVERRVGERLGDAFAPLRMLNTALYYWHLRADAMRTFERVAELDRGGRQRVYMGLWSRAAHWWCRRLREAEIPYGLFAYGLELRRELGPVWRRRRSEDVRAARTVFACSEATAGLVRDRYGGVEPVAVPPGITGPDDPEAVREVGRRLRRELDIPEEARVLVTVGRLVRRKGVHRVLEGLASEGLDDPGIRYVVAGSGPDRSRLEGLARRLGVRDRVDFLGHVDEETKWAVHALADVFVMPSGEGEGRDWEGFGIVFLEAAVLGVPSIAGRSGGAGEAVEHGRTGLLVEPDSAAGLREALQKLLHDAGLRRDMGRRARERALREFSWRRAAGKVLAAWRG